MKTLLVIAFLALAVTPAAFMLAGDSPAEAPDSATKPVGLSERSVYQVTSEWYDQEGQRLELASLAGRPQLVAMVFTHCGYACPRIVDVLKSIVDDLPEGERSKIGVLLVSIDPERDTSEALMHFSEMHDLPAPQWTLVRGDDGDIRELSAILGVRYKKEAGGEFAHSNTITLLDAGGEIVARTENLDGGSAGLVGKIREIL